MSKKATDTIETECGKSLTNVVLWSDGVGISIQIYFPTINRNNVLERVTWLVLQLYTPWPRPNWWRRRNHQKRHFPKSKVRSDCNPYTRRIFWCCLKICAIYYYCVLAKIGWNIPIKAIAGVQRAGMVYRRWEWMVPFVNNGFTKHVFTFKCNF